MHILQGLAGGSYAQQWTCDAAESGLSLDSEVWGIKKADLDYQSVFFPSLSRHILLYLLGLLSRCGSLCVGENYGCLHDSEPYACMCVCPPAVRSVRIVAQLRRESASGFISMCVSCMRL